MILVAEATVDPTTRIIERGAEDGEQFVVYETTDGERWVIRGVCSACGECEVGAVNPDLTWTGVPVGQPSACIDRRFGDRPDVPVRPELTVEMPHCSLRGEYL